MKCEQIRDMLHMYVDQELESSEQTQVNLHLGSCTACSAEWHNLNHISAVLSRLPKVAPPYPIVDQVMIQLERNPYNRFKRFVSHRNTWRLATGTIAACFAFAFVMLQTNQPLAGELDQMPQNLSVISKQMDANDTAVDNSLEKGPGGNETIQEDTNSNLEVRQTSIPIDKSVKIPAVLTNNEWTKVALENNQFVSLDEQYVATNIDQQVTIIGQADQQIVFQSTYVWKPDDIVILQAWSAASELTYSVSHLGQEQWYRIDLSQSTEIEIPIP